LLSGRPDGDTQLLNVRTVSFTRIKAARSKCLGLQIKKNFLFEYPVCAINRTVFPCINGVGLKFWNIMQKRGYSVSKRVFHLMLKNYVAPDISQKLSNELSLA